MIERLRLAEIDAQEAALGFAFAHPQEIVNGLRFAIEQVFLEDPAFADDRLLDEGVARRLDLRDRR